MTIDESMNSLIDYANTASEMDKLAPIIKDLKTSYEDEVKGHLEADAALKELQDKYNSLSVWTAENLNRQEVTADAEEDIVVTLDSEELGDAIADSIFNGADAVVGE